MQNSRPKPDLKSAGHDAPLKWETRKDTHSSNTSMVVSNPAPNASAPVGPIGMYRIFTSEC